MDKMTGLYQGLGTLSTVSTRLNLANHNIEETRKEETHKSTQTQIYRNKCEPEKLCTFLNTQALHNSKLTHRSRHTGVEKQTKPERLCTGKALHNYLAHMS